jgi:sec-independent protein translocase protein TatA
MPGMGELLVILVIVLLVFGAGKLPQIGDSLGRSIKNFKRAAGGSGDDELEVSKNKEIAAKSAEDVEDAEVIAPRTKHKVEK